MNCIRCTAFILVLAYGVVHAADIDSSEILFDDTKIHTYAVQFYYAGWQDSLEYYKSLPDEEYIPARFVCRLSATDSIVLDSIGVRYKGNSSYTYAANSRKKPFKFSFGKYKDGQKFFGIKKLNFSNGAKDPTMMREKISYDIISRYMKSPRTAFATITLEGECIGLYTQIEQVDKTFLNRHFSNDGGNLYKSSDDGSTLLYKGANQSTYQTEYELKTNESDNDWSYFIDFIDKLNNTANDDFISVMNTIMDLDNSCRYLAVNMVLSNFDSYTGSGRNFYIYDEPSTDVFTLIPWDLNLSFGAYANTWNVTTVNIVTVPNVAQRPLNKRILENDSLRQVYLGYIRSMIASYASVDSVTVLANRYKQLIDSCVMADSNKLHSYDDFVKNVDADVSVLDNMSRVTIPGLISFCKKRADALRTQLDLYLPVKNPINVVVKRAYLVCSSYGIPHTVTLQYCLYKQENNVSIEIRNLMGKKIFSQSNLEKSSGTHQLRWNTLAVTPGYYIAVLHTGDKNEYRTKIVVTR